MMQVAHMFVDHVAKTEVVADRDRERASGLTVMTPLSGQLPWMVSSRSRISGVRSARAGSSQGHILSALFPASEH
jgi:hypothetical protein